MVPSLGVWQWLWRIANEGSPGEVKLGGLSGRMSKICPQCGELWRNRVGDQLSVTSCEPQGVNTVEKTWLKVLRTKWLLESQGYLGHKHAFISTGSTKERFFWFQLIIRHVVYSLFAWLVHFIVCKYTVETILSFVQCYSAGVLLVNPMN